ncbi:MAG: hypothetical protein KGI80_06315 [Verrucomicrobiota bacterium]|nr:hypothetical protein [Verrucomicrobiota bacterium]
MIQKQLIPTKDEKFDFGAASKLPKIDRRDGGSIGRKIQPPPRRSILGAFTRSKVKLFIFCGYTYFLLFASLLHANFPDLKVLVLIIASDDIPAYVEDQKIWQTYMHKDPAHIEAYFLKNRSDLVADVQIDGDTIWVKGEENLKPGILNKTIAAMEFLLPKIQTTFTHVLRTNLSSFFCFSRLLEFLETCPPYRLYTSGGSFPGHYSNLQKEYFGLGSGCGFLLSPDLVALLVEHKKDLALTSSTVNDDVCIGLFLREKLGVTCMETRRMDFWTAQDLTQPIPSTIFHFRIKHPNQQTRAQNEHCIFQKLLTEFYTQKK